MSEDNGNNAPLRIYITGSCEGLAEIVEALPNHANVELVGIAEDVPEAASALTGGHLDAVIHATRGSEFPKDAYSAIREYTRAPVILLCSGECSGILAEALDAEVADVIPLPQLTENIVFAIRKACQAERRSGAATSHMGKVVTVFSPKGGIGKTCVSTNLAATFAKYHKERTLLLDIPTIKNVRLGLQTLELLSFPNERIRVILNRANTNVGLKRGKVEETLRTKVHVELPSDRAVPMAVNRGKPVALAEPGADFSKAMRNLADHVAA